MGAENETPSSFNPFEGMDPDNINCVHSINYDQIQALLENLPEGWIKNPTCELKPGQPPYLHEPSGDTSWKNPNVDKLMQVVNAVDNDVEVDTVGRGGKRKTTTSIDNNSSINSNSSSSNNNNNNDNHYNAKEVKKLRLMLRAGAPLGAVEQKAKLEGIDMSLVLSVPPSKKDSKKGHGDSHDGGEKGEEEGIAMISETLVKKYKRMIKAGIPMDRVQQLAGVEAGISPEQVVQILKHEKDVKMSESVGGGEVVGTIRRSGGGSAKVNSEEEEGKGGNNNIDSVKVGKDAKVVNPRIAKFVRMQKAGIPLPAIQNAAILQGFDVDELNSALGVDVESVDKRAEKEDASVEKVVKPDCSYEEADVVSPRPFTPSAGQVSFPCKQGQSYPLTDLVRKMAQTVEKTSRFGNMNSNNEMIVDNQTLFNALGSLKGVQFARDEYNESPSFSSIYVGNENNNVALKELIYSKCHDFIEMATSIGMTLPESVGEPVDVKGLDELVHHIESMNKDEIERGKLFVKDGYYDFDSLHVLYSPGSYVIAKHAGGGGVDCVTQVVWSRYTQGKTIFGKPMKYFQLCVRFIVPVGGGKASFAEVVHGMEFFEGRRSLWASSGGMGLSFVPISNDSMDKDKLLSSYKRRGEMYNKIASAQNNAIGDKMTSFLEYQKGSFYQKNSGAFTAGKSSAALAASGRIVVDFDAAIENGYSLSIGRDDMVEGLQLKMKEYKMRLRSIDQHKENNHGCTNGSHSVTGSGGMVLLSQLPNEFCALMWPNLIGFSLTSKSWGDVSIDGLSEITYDKDIFDRLVLEDTSKRMIKALVKHTNAEGGFRDLVKGKGEGTVFLLYGEPGVGKTLTAEAVAEFLERPLFSISMGTLGTTADELERRLGEILQLSARWNAILLLDEADSFLESRSSNSPLERNAMVSVMLRLVEYHQGIMFLTSNRIDSLDRAFQTRITLALRYEALDLVGRAKVWENLLVKSGYEDSMGSFDLKMLAKISLNGREIKNALRLAMALASDEGISLSQNLLTKTAAVIHGHKNDMNVNWDDEEVARGCLWSWWG